MHDPADKIQRRLHRQPVDKRAQIVEAARTVLARDGLAGCTVRAVADASPLTKSAIHYYFQNMDDLIDQAMAAHVAAFSSAIRTAVSQHTPITERFWSAVSEYLSAFRREPHSVQLWIEYSRHSAQTGRLEPVSAMYHEVETIFTELLGEIGVDAPDRRARALNCYLLGAAVRQLLPDYSSDTVRTEIALLCRLA
jgi:AcrR family transcriptional regulator